MADPLLLRQRRRTAASRRMVSEQLGEIDAREINSIPIGDRRRAWSCGSAATGRTCSGASERASVPEDLAPDELTVERADRAARAPGRPTGSSAPTRPAGSRSSSRPAGSVPTSRSARPTSRGQAADGFAAAPHGPRHPHLDDALRLLTLPRVRRGRPGRRRGDRGHQRPLRALPEEGDRFPLAGERGPALHRDPDEAAGRLRPAQEPPGPGRGRAAAARARGRPGDRRRRSCSRRAASVPT